MTSPQPCAPASFLLRAQLSCLVSFARQGNSSHLRRAMSNCRIHCKLVFKRRMSSARLKLCFSLYIVFPAELSLKKIPTGSVGNYHVASTSRSLGSEPRRRRPQLYFYGQLLRQSATGPRGQLSGPRLLQHHGHHQLLRARGDGQRRPLVLLLNPAGRQPERRRPVRHPPLARRAGVVSGQRAGKTHARLHVHVVRVRQGSEAYAGKRHLRRHLVEQVHEKVQ